jgi:hypothetical protein
MAEGRQRDEWQHTSSLLALFYNCHRDPKKGKPATPRDFDPTAPKAKPVRIQGLGLLRDIFVRPPDHKPPPKKTEPP